MVATRSMTAPVILYGMGVSGNTARARTYLINAGIPYRERAPNSEHYLGTIVPLAGGVRTMPTAELDDGTVIRDGAAIIAHFEAQSGHTFSPKTPKQKIVSRLFDVIGAEGLLRPGMHYRWNFDSENSAFIDFHAEKVMPPGFYGEEIKRAHHDRMRSATRRFGVTPETRPLVEALYLEFLSALNVHFSSYPYLLGGRPCIGDFGLAIMLFGHLGRDPKPLSIMHAHGLNVFRWLERINRHEPDFVEFNHQDEAYLADDVIPETLIDVLRTLAQDFVPETLAAAETINAWISGQTKLSPGSACERGLGTAQFDVKGTSVSALAAPYRFYLLQRVQLIFAGLDHAEKSGVIELLDACGMSPVLHAKLDREIGRKDNREVWL